MLNNIKTYLLLFVSVTMIGLTGCEDITELNVDPNNPTAIPAENLLTQAQQQLNNRLWSRGLSAEWGMLMVQQWSQNEYAEESRYTVDGNNFDVEWVDLYSDVLNELKTATELVTANEGLPSGVKANQLAILSILREYTFHNLTDLYGALPYTSALDPVNSPLPSYDSQSTIYAGIVANLQSALNSMDTGSASFASGDAIFGGDAAAWKRFGNSLLLRVAMRMSNVDEEGAKKAIASISGGYITSNTENALFVFDENPAIANPLFVDAVINTRDDFAVSDVLVNALKDMSDPRLEAFAALTLTGEYVGMPPGLPDADAFALKSTTSRPNDAVRAATAPAVMMDHAEVSFLLAEAYARDMLTGDAEAAYNEGVTASLDYWGIADATDYLAANPYDAGNWKQSIGMQKWIAFYMNGPQAWAEWRRLDVPALDVPAAATNPVIPVRLPYPISEQTRNSTQLGTVTSDPNDLSTKLWWDVN